MGKSKILDIELMRDFFSKDDLTCVDVGAFTGNYAIAIVNEFPAATVHAIEACPINYRAMFNKVGGYPGIVPHYVAISDCCCDEIDFFTTVEAKARKKHGDVTSQSNSLFGSFLSERGKKADKVSVRSLSMDGFCEENNIGHIDYLKINCEGCEFKIFESDTLDFLDSTTMVAIAIHGKTSLFVSDEYMDKRRRIVDRIRDSGFTMLKGDKDLSSEKHIIQIWIRG